MEEVDESKFKEASKLPAIKQSKALPTYIEPSEDEFKEMVNRMNTPVESLKEVTVKIKHFLDARMQHEMMVKGYLTDITKRWVDTYLKALELTQKALYGDKSVNVHLHKTISHSDIATKIREAKLVESD